LLFSLGVGNENAWYSDRGPSGAAAFLPVQPPDRSAYPDLDYFRIAHRQGVISLPQRVSFTKHSKLDPHDANS
jgi:hypothetical protein